MTDFSIIARRVWLAMVSLSVAQTVPAAPGVPNEIERLRAAVTAVQFEVFATQATLAGLRSNLSDLRASNNALRGNIATLQNSVATVQTTNATLVTQVSALQAAQAAVGVTRFAQGSVLFNGSIVSGTGFTVLPVLPEGRYIVVHTPPRFTSTPSCVVSAQSSVQPADGNNFYCKIDTVDVAGLVVQCYAPPSLFFTGNYANSVNNAATSSNFQFMCAQ